MLQQNVKREILMAATGSANQANISPDTIKNVDIIIPNANTFNLKVKKLTAKEKRHITASFAKAGQ
jgi:restriction endonuclease S subunit